jgi:hypothetical protein
MNFLAFWGFSLAYINGFELKNLPVSSVVGALPIF